MGRLQIKALGKLAAALIGLSLALLVSARDAAFSTP
jgi:hypothetical protein